MECQTAAVGACRTSVSALFGPASVAYGSCLVACRCVPTPTLPYQLCWGRVGAIPKQKEPSRRRRIERLRNRI
eukprot:356120-Chlamydomonas_euryale.AAC.19